MYPGFRVMDIGSMYNDRKKVSHDICDDMPFTTLHFFSRRQFRDFRQLTLFLRFVSQRSRRWELHHALPAHGFSPPCRTVFVPITRFVLRGDKSSTRWRTVENHAAASAIGTPSFRNKARRLPAPAYPTSGFAFRENLP